MSENDERRYKLALQNIVSALGPDRVCDCTPDDGCCEGLREEAAEALSLAKKALEHFELPRKHGAVFNARRKGTQTRIEFVTVVDTAMFSEGLIYLRKHDLRPIEESLLRTGFEDFKEGHLPPPASVPDRLQPESIGLNLG
jgi:hypothetical protein